VSDQLHQRRRANDVYVDIGALLARNLTGIGRFVARLVEALSRRTSLRLFNSCRGSLAKHMRLSKALPFGQEIAVSQHILPSADDDLDVWVGRLLRLPRRPIDEQYARSCTTIFTCLRPDSNQSRHEIGILYDFSPVLLPWAQLGETRRHFMRFYAETASRCDRVLAISHSTRHDAGWLSSIPRDRIVAAYPGPSLCTSAHASARAVAQKRNLALVVSTLEPRKNGRFLLDWFYSTEALDSDMELWWVGPRGWLWQNYSPTKDARFRHRRLKFLGVVSDQRLCQLYQQAAFTIYPSVYEGFGFPVLDSLRHGTPVLCAFHSSLQEFAGPGVYYFDPYDAQTLDEACRTLGGDLDGGFRRDDLEIRFSWDRLAEQVMACC
jgi:glycosyltransferase involved in cell wall biosynthesis